MQEVYGKDGISSRILIDGDDAAGRHRLCDPGISTDNAAMADYGVAAQNGGTCVDSDVVLNSWMTLAAALLLADAEGA